MKKFTEILSFILTGIFVVGGLFLTIAVIGVIMDCLSYSPSTGLGGLLSTIFIPFLIAGAIAVGLLAVSAVIGGLTAFSLIKTADKKFQSDENKVKRIVLKCIAYGILIVIVVHFAGFFN